MDCCGDDSSTVSVRVQVQQSTFAQIFNRIHSLVYSILDGSILNEELEADPNMKQERHEAIVSLLFILHLTVVFFFIAHHCTPQARGASFH